MLNFIASSNEDMIEELNTIKLREWIDERNSIESLSKSKQDELLEEIANNIVDKQVRNVGLKDYLDAIDINGDGIRKRKTRGRRRKLGKLTRGRERKRRKRTRERARGHGLKKKIT